jgi:hypothetical protein
LALLAKSALAAELSAEAKGYAERFLAIDPKNEMARGVMNDAAKVRAVQ